MDTILLAIVSVTALGVVCAVLLAVASKVMAVETDGRVAQLRELLPGVNCGACGHTGCDGYAEALADGGVPTNACTPGGDETAKAISAVLGVEAEDVLACVAVVCCGGDFDARRGKMDYAGIQTCAAAKKLYGGQNACVYGCLGFGDCAAVCPEGAICVESGLARVDTRKCVGCRLCAAVCPSGIIHVDSYSAPTAIVLCKNTERGAVVRKKCQKGCIGCMKCVKECPEEAIAVSDNLAVVDRAKCTGCGICATVCIMKCI